MFPGKYNDGTPYEDWYNTVVFAIGRDPETTKINLEAAGVQTNPKTGKVRSTCTFPASLSNFEFCSCHNCNPTKETKVISAA